MTIELCQRPRSKLRYLFSVMAYGLQVLADLFAVRGHVLKKWLFFRFAEGVRPYKPPYSRSAGSGQFVKAADPEKQTLLRLDPLIQHRTKTFAITLNTYKLRGITKLKC